MILFLRERFKNNNINNYRRSGNLYKEDQKALLYIVKIIKSKRNNIIEYLKLRSIKYI